MYFFITCTIINLPLILNTGNDWYKSDYHTINICNLGSLRRSIGASQINIQHWHLPDCQKSVRALRLLIDPALKALSCHLCVLVITRCGEIWLLYDECCLYMSPVCCCRWPHAEMQVFEAVFTLGSIAWSRPEFDSTSCKAHIVLFGSMLLLHPVF